MTFCPPASAIDRSGRGHGQQHYCHSLPYAGEAYLPIIQSVQKLTQKQDSLNHRADFQHDIKILNLVLWLILQLTSFPLSSQERPFLRTQTNSPTEREEKASTLTDPVSLSTQNASELQCRLTAHTVQLIWEYCMFAGYGYWDTLHRPQSISHNTHLR